MKNRRLSLLLRLAVTAIFGALALWGTGASAVLDDLAAGRPSWIAGALAVLALAYVVAAVRWWRLLRGQDIEVGFPTVLRLTWIGLFAGNLLPSGFGGDAVRAWMGGHHAGSLALATASVLVDRLTAVWALLGLGVVAVLAHGGELPSAAIFSLLASSALVAIGSVLLFAPGPARALVHATRRWPGIARRVRRLSEGLQLYGRRPRLLVAAVVTSLIGQSCVVVAAWMLAQGLGLDLGLDVVAITVPVALLATAAPTSINGLGVHQAVFRALLVPAGIAPSEAVAFSLATVAAGAVVSLPGSVLWVLRRRRGGSVVRVPVAVGPSPPPRMR